MVVGRGTIQAFRTSSLERQKMEEQQRLTLPLTAEDGTGHRGYKVRSQEEETRWAVAPRFWGL